MKKPIRILIVEDEEPIRSGLTDVFVYHGYEVDAAASGPEGLEKALSGRFDLVVLDVMLPGMNGFDICNEIRATDRDQAIIMLTAKCADEEIIRGLRLGADDYVTKPFSIAQLVVRVEAVMRRTRSAHKQHATIHLGNTVQIDTLNLSGHNGNDRLLFTRREMDILEYLALNTVRPVSREELLTKVWGYARDLDIETRTVDIHIAKLRRKIESEPGRPEFLLTVRGAGYRLVVGA